MCGRGRAQVEDVIDKEDMAKAEIPSAVVAKNIDLPRRPFVSSGAKASVDFFGGTMCDDAAPLPPAAASLPVCGAVTARKWRATSSLRLSSRGTRCVW